MDSEEKLYRPLPPLVEGRIHGTLKLIINEILWTRRSPGDVTVVASWWGEHDSAQFRPIDGTTSTARTNDDTTEMYAVKTNATLFENYIKNCDTIELVIIVEKTREVIGTAHVGELLKILACRPCFQYVPILNNNGSRIGKIHVSLHLMYFMEFPNMQLKARKYAEKQVHNDVLLPSVNNLQYEQEVSVVSHNNIDNIKKRDSTKSIKFDTCDIYKSVLKAKRSEFQESRKKFNETMMDNIVAQIVARAQRLRGAILKETYNEDPLAPSDSSMSNGLYTSAKNEAKLYEYILGKEMTSSEEKKALDILRSTSPTSSLIDLTFKTIKSCKHDNTDNRINDNSSVKSSCSIEDTSHRETTYIESKGAHPLDYVDSIRIFIESFTLSSAGYRRAKSTCLQHGVPLSLTYFIQYDATFGHTRQMDIRCNKEAKFVKTCAKKQMDQVVDFNSEYIHSISRSIVNTDLPLKFKVFVRHLNQKLPAELGYGSINIRDIVNTTNLSSTQCITITNKGIKLGELKITAELGRNLIGFGKEFIGALISTKENIPLLKIKSVVSTNGNRYKSTTGTHSSKSNSKVSSVPAKRIECLTGDSNKDLVTAKDTAEHRERSLDNKKIDTSNPEMNTKDKILLHGLIYIAEGKDLPEPNTYLICRAFWREDKTTSQICSDTKNPFYHFCQLVSLIHGTELLERIRDNYIIIEVYSRRNSEADNLLGIAKLPVHQLYLAYRDPLVLPHLLLSKYPVISVDDWVCINDPVSGKSNGELLALVALGTAEQIAFLETSRGLRNISDVPQPIYNYQCYIPNNANYTLKSQGNVHCNVPETLNNSEHSTDYNHFTYHIYGTSDRDLASTNYKTQESQTDISSLRSIRFDEPIQKVESSEHLALHTLVNRLANALNVNKTSTDQTAQTEIVQTDEIGMDSEDLYLNNVLVSNSLSDDSDSSGPRNNFHLPTEMYRSVGVGAEYDEEFLQQQNNTHNIVHNSPVIKGNSEKEEPSFGSDSPFFRAIVEIECALHLPKIERINESIEPSTYVTFQDLTRKVDGQLNSYVVTNVFLSSCNPEWNWRCDAKLPTELLMNNEKRLILKIWHLMDPDKTTMVNLEEDVVIGFSAVDVSVLMAGFPTVSGWFHIMDFTGKCNGQIKISIIPLDNLSSFGKAASITATNIPTCNLMHSNWPDSYYALYKNTDSHNTQQTLSQNEEEYVQTESKLNDCVAYVGYGLEDVSMSFLSSSLKQKLTELDEITKRLQLRLHDITDTAFEDEFENDFDTVEPNSDNENTDNRNEIATPVCNAPVMAVKFSNENLQTSKEQCKIQSDRHIVDDEKHTPSVISGNYNQQFELVESNQSRAINSGVMDIGYCSSSNTHFSQNSGHCYNQYQNRHSLIKNHLSDNSAEYPARGTRTHINHLLDKLSLQLPTGSPSETYVPIKKDIIELLTSLRENKSNVQNNSKSIHDLNTCSVPTQTDNISAQHNFSHTTNLVISDVSDVDTDENAPKLFEESQHCNRISTIIREELIAEENNDISNCDDLTTYLITSNVRHMDLDNTFNPLLYEHMIPDLQTVFVALPEGEAEQQLDNRYTKNFNTAICDSSNRTDHSTENNASSQVGIQTKNQANTSESEKSTELPRLTPSGVSRNVNDNINVTVIHKSSNNDVMPGNNTELIAVISPEESSMQQTDKETKNYCCIVSESSVSGVSRQAPDGGNPIEEIKTSAMIKRHDTQDVNKQLKLSDI